MIYIFFQHLIKGCLLYHRIDRHVHRRLIKLNTCLALIQFQGRMEYNGATCVDKGVLLHV